MIVGSIKMSITQVRLHNIVFYNIYVPIHITLYNYILYIINM